MKVQYKKSIELKTTSQQRNYLLVKSMFIKSNKAVAVAERCPI
jgi:hypothetical protein